jgi:hypothetical protein
MDRLTFVPPKTSAETVRCDEAGCGTGARESLLLQAAVCAVIAIKMPRNMVERMEEPSVV